MTGEEKRVIVSMILVWFILTAVLFGDVLAPAIAVALQWWVANR